jgi:hypothetical protein
MLTPQEIVVVAEGWIADLRANPLTQGRGKLKSHYGIEPRYCCAGRLCLITKEPTFMDLGTLDEGYHPKAFAVFETLSKGRHGENSYYNLNDDGLTFPQLAEIIERDLAEYKQTAQ